MVEPFDHLRKLRLASALSLAICSLHGGCQAVVCLDDPNIGNSLGKDV